MTVKTVRAQSATKTPSRPRRVAGNQARSSGFPDLEHDLEFAFIRLQLVALQEVLVAMEAEGLSRAELARRLGCSRANISRLLNENANFKMEMLAKLATALDRDVEIRLIRKDEAIVVRRSKPRLAERRRPAPPEDRHAGEKEERDLKFQKWNIDFEDDYEERYPFHIAAMADDVPRILRLIANGHDVNAHDEDKGGETALARVTQNCSREVARHPDRCRSRSGALRCSEPIAP